MTPPSTPQNKPSRGGRGGRGGGGGGRGSGRGGGGRGADSANGGSGSAPGSGSGSGSRGNRRRNRNRGGKGRGRGGGGGRQNNNSPNNKQNSKSPPPHHGGNFNSNSVHDHNITDNAPFGIQLSDEDVMIAFMKYLRVEQDEDARKIYLEYGHQRKVFVQKVREFLKQKGEMGGPQQLEKPPQFRSPADINLAQHQHQQYAVGNTSGVTSHSITGSAAIGQNQHHLGGGQYGNNNASSVPVIRKKQERSRHSFAQSNDHEDQVQHHQATEMERMVANLTIATGGATSTLPPLRVSTSTMNTSPPSSTSPSSMMPPPGIRTGAARSPVSPQTLIPPTPHSTPVVSIHGNGNVALRPEEPHIPLPKNLITPTLSPTSSPVKMATSPANSNQTRDTPATPNTLGTPTAPAATVPPPTKWQPRRINTRLQEQPGRILANNVPASLDHQPTSHVRLGPRKELTATWQLPLGYLRERTLRKLQKAKEIAATAAADAISTPEIEKDTQPQNLTIRDALRSLTVGLFRRGCAENGSQHSIISKEVVPADKNVKSEYQFQINQNNQTIMGTVPFFTPRTPGNVVLRLYFEDDPIVTLATSTCISVIVADGHGHHGGVSMGGGGDLEQTLRFILSNFKSKKGSTNFSSIHSLAAVLGQCAQSSSVLGSVSSSSSYQHQQYSSHRHQSGNRNYTQMDSAGRAAWGGICESRKIVDACKSDYYKKKAKLDAQFEQMERMKETLDELQQQEIDEQNLLSQSADGGEHGDHEEESAGDETASSDGLKKWKEKMNQYMGERNSNERKWREIQSAFASVLKNAIHRSGDSSPTLLKPDILRKLELEYYLWCPLCENFAPNPFEQEVQNHDENNDKQRSGKTITTTVLKYPNPITQKHFNMCKQSRAAMQKDLLGFVVKTAAICDDLPGHHSRQHQPQGSKVGGNGLVSKLSSAMETLYHQEYGSISAEIQDKKARVRELTNCAVVQCEIFPQGTKVVIFGSSANGFGSPNSDLDMCLQVPPDSATNITGEDMAKLADKLAEVGMIDVDTSRLTARIPVVKFNCRVEIGGSESIIECDISMQNPLACINTTLLQSYSTITPRVRILAAMVKRWAKRRDINDPSCHTLSSYGYIIMLLHFLTTHMVTQKGELVSIYGKRGTCPLIPNLQWMDQRWLQSPPGTPYTEWQHKPITEQSMMKHPTEETYRVNTLYLHINDQKVHNALTKRVSQAQANAHTPSVGYLLASFFKFYAYEFDYKKHVVSLNATTRSGTIEREAKAESDNWKLYGQSLEIEDPFEEFYDVAHVLKPINFQRIRRELALAYSKVLTAMDGKQNEPDAGIKLLNSICEEYIRSDD